MAMPLFTVTTPYQELPIQTESAAVKGALQGAQYAKTSPGLAESIASGFTAAVKDNEALADSQARRELTNTQTELAKLQIAEAQATQQADIEAKIAQDNALKTRYAEEVKTQEEKDALIQELQNPDPQIRVAAAFNGKYARAMADDKFAKSVFQKVSGDLTPEQQAIVLPNSYGNLTQRLIAQDKVKSDLEFQKIGQAVAADNTIYNLTTKYPGLFKGGIAEASQRIAFVPRSQANIIDGKLQLDASRQPVINKNPSPEDKLVKDEFVAYDTQTGLVLGERVKGNPAKDDNPIGLLNAFKQRAQTRRLNGNASAVEELVGRIAQQQTAQNNSAQPRSVDQGTPAPQADDLRSKTDYTINDLTKVLPKVPLYTGNTTMRISQNPNALDVASKSMGIPATIALQHTDKLSDALHTTGIKSPDALTKQLNYVTALQSDYWDNVVSKEQLGDYSAQAVQNHNDLVDAMERNAEAQKRILYEQVYAAKPPGTVYNRDVLRNRTVAGEPIEVFPAHKVKDAKELFIAKTTPAMLARFQAVYSKLNEAYRAQKAAAVNSAAQINRTRQLWVAP